MTERDHIPQEDLALYAMQALSGGESAVVRAHVAECPTCQAELAELTEDLALVAMSVEQRPVPEGARQRFIERISGASTDERREAPTPVVAMDAPRPLRRAAVWIPWVAVAALVLLTISLATKIGALKDALLLESAREASLAATASRAQEVLDVLTAQKAQRVTLTAAKSAPVPTARAVYVPERGGLIFQASNMAPLPAGKTYELWVIPANGTAPVPAGLFQPDTTGSASLVLPPLPKGVPAKAFGITIERAEGASTPTAPIILSGVAPTPGE